MVQEEKEKQSLSQLLNASLKKITVGEKELLSSKDSQG
jgi:hypothetical protein